MGCGIVFHSNYSVWTEEEEKLIANANVNFKRGAQFTADYIYCGGFISFHKIRLTVNQNT